MMGDTFSMEAEFTRYLSRRFRDAAFETFDIDHNPEVGACKTACERWAGEFPAVKRGLFLTGPVGTGKTHLAVAVGRAVAQRGHVVRFVDATTYLEKMKSAIGEGRTRMTASGLFRYNSLAVIDEIGAVKPTDFVVEQMYLLIDEAWHTETPLIVTSNLSYREIQETLGDRTASRLVDLTTRVEFGGADHRLRREP
jgi:DNA replication protein DnaC